MNYKLRVTPELSRAVQEKCFSNGLFWFGASSGKIKNIDDPFLYIDEDLTCCDDSIYFEEDENTEITFDEFMATPWEDLKNETILKTSAVKTETEDFKVGDEVWIKGKVLREKDNDGDYRIEIVNEFHSDGDPIKFYIKKIHKSISIQEPKKKPEVQEEKPKVHEENLIKNGIKYINGMMEVPQNLVIDTDKISEDLSIEIDEDDYILRGNY